jgi:hypothetical protein
VNPDIKEEVKQGLESVRLAMGGELKRMTPLEYCAYQLLEVMWLLFFEGVQS